VRAIGGTMAAVLSAISALSAVARAAEPRETIVMPHRCVVDGTRLLVLSASPQAYPIRGPRSETIVPVCRDGAACFDVRAHRFAIACEGGVVPWVEVAAALGHQRLGRTTVEAGSLKLHIDSAIAETKKKRPAKFLVFPPGHAPVDEVGAQIARTDDVPRPELAIRPASEPLPAHPEVASWLTVVERSDAPPTSLPTGRMIVGAVVTIIALGLAGTLLVARRRGLTPALIRYRLRRFGPSLSPRKTASADPEAQACGELEAIATDEIARAAEQAARLAPSPLRRALLTEVERHRRRVTTLAARADGTSPEWHALRRRFETAATEAARLRKIVDDAAKSLDERAAVREPAEPIDRMSAYEMLGASPDVSERVLKKLVEALRACWHPDLARDETDRARREQRIKDINVAWDIISGKRQEA
jgi:hypothetical protein